MFVGRTASPEFGIVPVTESRRFGPTRNPWDPSRTPGGSSGGSGAAVAAGMVPVAHASDGGGSIRIPASCCGLVGLKASRGRISRGPEFGDSFLATDGTLCRTVAEAAATLDILAGYEPGDATWAPPPSAPFAEAVGRDPGKLRIGFTTRQPMGVDPHAESVRGAEEAAQLLESLGHEIVPIDYEWPADEIVATFVDLWAGMVSVGVGYAATLGYELTPDKVEPLSWDLFQKGLQLPSTKYLGSLTRLQQISRELIGWWSDIDVLLTPGLGQRPVPIGDDQPAEGGGAVHGSHPRLVRLHALHGRVERHRAAGDLAAALPGRRRPADLDPAGRGRRSGRSFSSRWGRRSRRSARGRTAARSSWAARPRALAKTGRMFHPGVRWGVDTAGDEQG